MPFSKNELSALIWLGFSLLFFGGLSPEEVK